MYTQSQLPRSLYVGDLFESESHIHLLSKIKSEYITEIPKPACYYFTDTYNIYYPFKSCSPSFDNMWWHFSWRCLVYSYRYIFMFIVFYICLQYLSAMNIYHTVATFGKYIRPIWEQDGIKACPSSLCVSHHLILICLLQQLHCTTSYGQARLLADITESNIDTSHSQYKPWACSSVSSAPNGHRSLFSSEMLGSYTFYPSRSKGHS